jgi:Fur family ferric uptake transcriptional regulator
MLDNPSIAELKTALRDAGLRATASRLAVLRALRAALRPVSHAEVVQALADSPWDRATVYRNLVDLAGAGLAQKVELGDRVWRFHSGEVASHGAAMHPHFICVQCGDVSCLPDVSMNVPRRGVPRSLKSRTVEVHLRGVCDTCA